MPETNINTDFIVEEYGKIYQQRGQGLNRIKRALIQTAETLEKYATHKRLTDDIYEMTNDEFQPVLQPFRVNFEPKGGVKFHPNKIVLQHIKVDLNFSPDQIIDSWLGFLEGPGVDRSQWPITRYMIEIYLKQQIDYDREVNAVYYGERNDNGTTPSDCMDGIRKHLVAGANSEYPVNIISGIGKLEPLTCFDQVEKFSKKMKAIYRNVPIIICVSQDYERCFLENKRANGFYWLHGPEDLNASVDFTKQVVMGLPSMGEECGDMFAFVRGNLLWCTRKDKFNFDIQKQDRFVKVLADWREGIGFGVNKMVWATDYTVGAGAIDIPDSETGETDGIVVRSSNPIRITSAEVKNEECEVSIRVAKEAVENCLEKHSDEWIKTRGANDDADDLFLQIMPVDALKGKTLEEVVKTGPEPVFIGHLYEILESSNTGKAISEELDRLHDEWDDIGPLAFVQKYGTSNPFQLALERIVGDKDSLDLVITAPYPFYPSDLRAVALVRLGTDVYASSPFPVNVSNDVEFSDMGFSDITANSAVASVNINGAAPVLYDEEEDSYAIWLEKYSDGVISGAVTFNDGVYTMTCSDLSANTTYRVRFVLELADGTVKRSPWLTFKTLSN